MNERWMNVKKMLFNMLICMWICMCLSLGSGMVWYIVKCAAVLRIIAQENCTKLSSVENKLLEL